MSVTSRREHRILSQMTSPQPNVARIKGNILCLSSADSLNTILNEFVYRTGQVLSMDAQSVSATFAAVPAESSGGKLELLNWAVSLHQPGNGFLAAVEKRHFTPGEALSRRKTLREVLCPYHADFLMYGLSNTALSFMVETASGSTVAPLKSRAATAEPRRSGGYVGGNCSGDWFPLHEVGNLIRPPGESLYLVHDDRMRSALA